MAKPAGKPSNGARLERLERLVRELQEQNATLTKTVTELQEEIREADRVKSAAKAAFTKQMEQVVLASVSANQGRIPNPPRLAR